MTIRFGSYTLKITWSNMRKFGGTFWLGYWNHNYGAGNHQIGLTVLGLRIGLDYYNVRRILAS